MLLGWYDIARAGTSCDPKISQHIIDPDVSVDPEDAGDPEAAALEECADATPYIKSLYNGISDDIYKEQLDTFPKGCYIYLLHNPGSLHKRGIHFNNPPNKTGAKEPYSHPVCRRGKLI